MNEEREEKTFAKMEQQIAKSEMTLKGMNERERSWFQTMKQRKQEKDRLETNFKAIEDERKRANEPTKPDANGKRKADLSKFSESKRRKREEMDRKRDTSNKHPSQLAKQRYIQSKENASVLRAKASKSLHKVKRIRQVDEAVESRSVKNKRQSKFSVDLTGTGSRRAKQLR